MMYQPVRVVIADDHPVVRQGLCAILDPSIDMRIVGVATTFDEVLTVLETVLTDVLVLDLGGMGTPPLMMVRQVRVTWPQIGIVVFSGSMDLAPEVLQAGVCGYIVKEDLSEQLLAAIREARKGMRFVSPTVAEYVERTTAQRRTTSLSPKEVSVLKLLASGLGTIAIAEQLGLDPRSVQNYISVLRRKTGCAERTELVLWYRRVYDPGA